MEFYFVICGFVDMDSINVFFIFFLILLFVFFVDIYLIVFDKIFFIYNVVYFYILDKVVDGKICVRFRIWLF